MRLLSILILSKIIIGRSVLFSENLFIVPFLALEPFFRLSRPLIILAPFNFVCNVTKTKQNRTEQNHRTITSNIIILSMCLAFNSFVLYIFHLLDSFIFCFSIVFNALCIIFFTHTRARARTERKSHRTKLDSIMLFLLSFVI